MEARVSRTEPTVSPHGVLGMSCLSLANGFLLRVIKLTWGEEFQAPADARDATNTTASAPRPVPESEHPASAGNWSSVSP